MLTAHFIDVRRSPMGGTQRVRGDWCHPSSQKKFSAPEGMGLSKVEGSGMPRGEVGFTCFAGAGISCELRPDHRCFLNDCWVADSCPGLLIQAGMRHSSGQALAAGGNVEGCSTHASPVSGKQFGSCMQFRGAEQSAQIEESGRSAAPGCTKAHLPSQHSIPLYWSM